MNNKRTKISDIVATKNKVCVLEIMQAYDEAYGRVLEHNEIEYILNRYINHHKVKRIVENSIGYYSLRLGGHKVV